jgi:hypothetical protein
MGEWAHGPFKLKAWIISDCSLDTFSNDGGNMGGMTILQSPFEFANSGAMGCFCLPERM